MVLRFFYHATPASNLPGIAGSGLLPNRDRPTNWDGYPVAGKLFACSSLKAAEFYTVTLAGMTGEEAALLRFPGRVVRTTRDPFGNHGDRFTPSGVDPGDLEIRRGGTWKPIRAVVRPCPARETAPVPDTVGPVGPLTLFPNGYGWDATSDGRPPRQGDDLGNLVVRLAVSDGMIVDAATPRVAEYREDVSALLDHLGLPARGRGASLLARHGLHPPGTRVPGTRGGMGPA